MNEIDWTESVHRREEGSTGKYQHEVKGVPEGAARGNPSTECWYFPVLPDSSQGTDITQFIMLVLLLYMLEKATFLELNWYWKIPLIEW